MKPSKGEQGGQDDVLERIRTFPKGASAEDQMRVLMRGGISAVSIPDSDSESDEDYTNNSAQEAMDYLYDIMEREGPFDGILGYSEGATIAATLLLHEQRRFEREGRLPMLKCGLFFGGWPPMTPELDGLVLADETDLMITVPTCHISKLLGIFHVFSCLIRG